VPKGANVQDRIERSKDITNFGGLVGNQEREGLEAVEREGPKQRVLATSKI